LLGLSKTDFHLSLGDDFLVRLVDPRERELRILLWLLAGLVVLQSAIGMLSWLAPAVLPHAWLGRAGERAVGTLGGPGPYGATLMFGAALAISYLRVARTSLSRGALYLVVLAAFLGVAITFSRGSWLGATLVFAGLLVTQRDIAIKVLSAFLVALVLLGMGPMSTELPFAVERLGDEDTADSRLITNDAAVRMIDERPLLGFGYGNFETVDESFKMRVGDIPVEEGSAHHSFLALAAENGLPALVLYLFPAGWLLLLTLRRWHRITAEHPMNRTLLIVLWLALLHQAVVMNFMDMLHSSGWGTALWWLALGLIHVVISRASGERTEPDASSAVGVGS
jgi:O-antigen ligase